MVNQTSEKRFVKTGFLLQNSINFFQCLHYINERRPTALSFFSSLNKLRHDLLGAPHCKWLVGDVTCFLEILC
jgi:hypothetical protein